MGTHRNQEYGAALSSGTFVSKLGFDGQNGQEFHLDLRQCIAVRFRVENRRPAILVEYPSDALIAGRLGDQRQFE